MGGGVGVIRLLMGSVVVDVVHGLSIWSNLSSPD